MRLVEYISNQEFREIGRAEVLTKIVSACGPFLKGLKILAWRGSQHTIDTIEEFTPRTDRKPLDTAEHMHDTLDELFERKFGWKARSGGIFASGDVDMAKKFAKGHDADMFFPIGKFKFVWNPDVSDLTMDLGHYAEDDYDIDMENAQEIYNEQYGPDSENGHWKDKQGKIIGSSLKDFKKIKGFVGGTGIEDNQASYFIRNPKGQELEKTATWVPEIDFDNWIEDLRRDEEVRWLEEAYEEANRLVNDYIDRDLNKALASGHEVTFKCDRYYLAKKDLFTLPELLKFRDKGELPGQYKLPFMKGMRRKYEKGK